MAIRQRAIQEHDKQERHSAILDAAERLLLRSPDRVPNVADVAEEAGLAKGTVYLYFPSKEALLLAIHERNVEEVFADLNAALNGPPPVNFNRLMTIVLEHILERPLFLPLASRCLALMAQSVPAETAAGYQRRMAARLEFTGAALARHFPRLRPGEGPSKLRHSFALIIGLWQMAAASMCSTSTVDAVQGLPAAPSPFGWSYQEELARALRGLWQNVTSVPPVLVR